MQRLLGIVAIVALFAWCGEDNTNNGTVCEDSSDCDLSQGIVCIDSICQRYVDNDQCFEQPCTESCATCGLYTTCINGICEDACFARLTIQEEVWDNVCNDIINIQRVACNICSCWLDDRQVVDGANTCKPRIITCRDMHAEDAKKQLEEGIDEFKEIVEHNLRISCLN